MSFVSIKTEIDGLVTKEAQIIEKVGGLVAQAIIENAKENKSSSKEDLEKLVNNLIGDFNAEQRVVILTKAVAYITMNGKFAKEGNNRSSNRDTSSRSSLFGKWD